MPGRQAHGRPVGSVPGASGSGKGKGKKRSKSKSTKNALDAFAIASKTYGDRHKLTPRNRELDAPLDGPRGGKHAREEEQEDDNDEDEDEEEGPPRKMRRGAENRRRGGGEDDDNDDGEEDVEYGSDGSGNEWRVGVDDDDDSEIDSDDAFGESDEERFDDYAFRGSKKKEADEDADDEDGADGASLGSDAIDLADALDMSMSEDDGEPGANQDSEGSDQDESAEDESGSSDASSSSTDDDDDDEDDDVSDSGINAWVSQFSGVKDTDEQYEDSAAKKPKIGLKDLGLLAVKDPQLKKSVKLMSKEDKESTKKQKLDVPLARRQQAALDRAAAYTKTNETLDRWTETVKQNRRADHLVFPLPQTETGLVRHDNTEIQPLTNRMLGNELEQTVLAIMEESGLGPSAKKEANGTQGEDSMEGQTVSRSELKSFWNKKRQEREAKSREEQRAKRIKKIKSKAYHRVHRKQRERDEIKEHEVRVAAGEIDSEDEREAQDRQRAMERMGSRHRESKWAKMSNKGGRAAWDDDVRIGIADMARRDEELRRRIEGKPLKTNEDDEEESDYSGDSDDVDERKRLLQQLNEVPREDDSRPRSKLMDMEFMKKAEATKKKANDDMVAQIRRELASEDDEDQGESDAELHNVGRKHFGQPSSKKSAWSKEQSKGSKKGKAGNADGLGLQAAKDNIETVAASRSQGLSATVSKNQTGNPLASAWGQPASSGPAKKQRGKKAASGADVLDLSLDSVAVIPNAALPQSKAKAASKQTKRAERPSSTSATSAVALPGGGGGDSSDDDDGESHLPIQFREQELLDKAFGGLDAVADFEQEKAAIAEEDDDKVVDNTLPGWGSWVGDGVSKREQKRHQGRFLAKQEGARQKKDRRDAKLKDVIINEKRIRKTEKYMASQLPHPYESRLQYERSLRLPVGPEWMTKETFQEATKPRVLLKQGVIAPIAKPMH